MPEHTTVLVFGDDDRPHHKIREYEPLLNDVFDGTGPQIDVTSDRTTFESDLSDYDALLNLHPAPRSTEWSLTDEQFDAIVEFVRAGGGYVALHAAAALLEDDAFHQRQADLLGGRLLGYPDTYEERIEVEVRSPDHPVMEGVESFVIYDEPYRMKCHDDATVLATLDCEYFGDTPACWVRREGDGRVCYYSNGHVLNAWSNPSFRRILTNAIHWVVG